MKYFLAQRQTSISKGQYFQKFHLQQQGFTLIELVIVIILLSVLAAGTVRFISFSAQGYLDTARRSALASTASIVNEKLSRALRQALPGSVRVNTDQSCVEFIPVLSASRYVQAPITGSPVPQTEVHAVPIDGALVQSGFISIYPVVANINSLYDNTNSPGYISSQTASITGTQGGASVFEFDSSATFEFVQGSPQNRMFVTDQPRAFCLQGNILYAYRNYGFVGDISNLSGSLPTSVPDRQLIANQIQTSSLRFSYTPSSLRRNALISYEMVLQESNQAETLTVNQEVQVRNVP